MGAGLSPRQQLRAGLQIYILSDLTWIRGSELNVTSAARLGLCTRGNLGAGEGLAGHWRASRGGYLYGGLPYGVFF